MARKIAREIKDIPEGSSLCVACRELKEEQGSLESFFGPIN